MANFVYDNLPLPETKSDRTDLPDGVPSSQAIRAQDFNRVSTYLGDLRTVVGDIAVDPSSAAPVLSTGSTTARTLANRFADVVNVKDFGAKGDGTTDDSAAFTLALTAAAAVRGEVYVPRGTYRLNSTLSVPAGVTLRGTGRGTVLRFVSVTTGIAVGDGSTLNVGASVRDLRVNGTGTTAFSVNNAQECVVAGVTLSPASGVTSVWTDGFSFTLTWASTYRDLWSNGATISNACFAVNRDFNACTALNWYTSNACTYNIILDAQAGGGGVNGVSHGSHFANMCAQGGLYGLYVKAYQGGTFSGVYTENVVKALVFGDLASSSSARGILVHGGSIGGPAPSHAQYASRGAVVDFDYAFGVVLSGVSLDGCFNCGTWAPLTFSGGGGTGAQAFARVTAAGVVHSVAVVNGGSGYTTAPTVTVGGAGTGATCTATITSNKVSSVSVTAGGTGYVPLVCPVAISYNNCRRVSVQGAYINSGVGLASPLYPWLVRKSGADSSGGVRLVDDVSLATSSGNSADLIKAQGFGFVHYVTEVDSAGNRIATQYVPPQFP